jgi:hypothetical protein
MTYEEEQDEAMIYASSEPNVSALQDAYKGCMTDLEEYFDTCFRAYEDRRNQWPGKTSDLRKHGANAFPWDGASDMEVNVVGERIDTYVALLEQALDRSHIKAFPTNHTSLGKASIVSLFLKWMRKSYIPNFKAQMELGANYLLEKGLMISYVGWKKEQRTFKQTATLEQLQEVMPQLVDMIVAGDDAGAMDIIGQAYPSMNKGRIRKAIKDLRQSGMAEVLVPRLSVDCPIVQACSPDSDVFFPSYVSDPQRSPYVFYRDFLTAQELEKKVTNEGWDSQWVYNAIEKLRGKDAMLFDAQKERRSDRLPFEDAGDLVMVVYAYQRLIDEEDGSEGIYCTVFHPDADGYAKHELMNGYDDYPFVVTRLSNDQKRLYETQNFADILRGSQAQVKTERDSRIDRSSLATLPPLMHPAGRPPGDWGPGRRVPYRRLGEFAFGPVPPFDPGSERLEMQMIEQANNAVGLNMANPLSAVRQQFVVNKFLDHVRDVLGLAFKLFQRMGPDEVFFQVTGTPDPQVMSKGDPDDNFSITVSFDTRETDPENVEQQMKNMATLMQLDRNGRIDADKLLELMSAQINPFMADYVLQPVEAAQDKMLKDVTDDLSKIFSGIEVPARPNGAQFAMQLVQQYASQPDIAQRLQQDEAFAKRLGQYAQQYQFTIQQQQNAVTGRIGTAPAQVGEVTTQGMST